MDKYLINYSDNALRDLRDIYEYIAFELKEPGTATAQVNRIRDSIRVLDTFPAQNKAVEWEPWSNRGMHQMPVDNFIVFYTTDDENFSVYIFRIFYGKRNIPSYIKRKR